MTCTHALPTTARRLIRDDGRPSGLRALLARWGTLRRQRRALAELDDRLLRDVGVAPQLAIGEAAKPFWR